MEGLYRRVARKSEVAKKSEANNWKEGADCFAGVIGDWLSCGAPATTLRIAQERTRSLKYHPGQQEQSQLTNVAEGFQRKHLESLRCAPWSLGGTLGCLTQAWRILEARLAKAACVSRAEGCVKAVTTEDLMMSSQYVVYQFPRATIMNYLTLGGLK